MTDTFLPLDTTLARWLTERGLHVKSNRSGDCIVTTIQAKKKIKCVPTRVGYETVIRRAGPVSLSGELSDVYVVRETNEECRIWAYYPV